MVCPYSPNGKKKGCEFYDEGSFTCDKSLDPGYCGRYNQLNAEEGK